MNKGEYEARQLGHVGYGLPGVSPTEPVRVKFIGESGATKWLTISMNTFTVVAEAIVNGATE